MWKKWDVSVLDWIFLKIMSSFGCLEARVLNWAYFPPLCKHYTPHVAWQCLQDGELEQDLQVFVLIKFEHDLQVTVLRSDNCILNKNIFINTLGCSPQ